MADERFSPAVRDAVTEVLETMFFACIGGEVNEAPQSDRVIATLQFAGEPSGTFSLAVTGEAAREMTANFLGCEDEIAQSQQEEVVRELTNMVCGSVLSQMESSVHFELSEPRTVSEFPPEEYRQRFELENGTLEVGLTTHS